MSKKCIYTGNKPFDKLNTKYLIKCAREPWDCEQYDLVRYCEDEIEVQKAVLDYIRCGYEIIDVRPYKNYLRKRVE